MTTIALCRQTAVRAQSVEFVMRLARTLYKIIVPSSSAGMSCKGHFERDTGQN